MPYSPPVDTQNPATGDPILASWGDAVNTGMDYLATNFPHCSVYNSGAVSSTTNVLLKMLADSELSDIGGMHSTVSNTSRITIPANEGGLYVCTATVAFDPNANGERLLRFLVDNTTAYPCQSVAANPTGGLGTQLNGVRTISIAAGSYVEVQIRQNSGGNLDVTLLDFSVRWIATA